MKRDRFHRLASDDLAEAVGFYEKERSGLGLELAEEVERTLSLLRAFPEAAPRVRGEFRRAVVSRFPYSLIYRIAGDVLRVVAVAHHKREPSYWVRRS